MNNDVMPGLRNALVFGACACFALAAILAIVIPVVTHSFGALPYGVLLAIGGVALLVLRQSAFQKKP